MKVEDIKLAFESNIQLNITKILFDEVTQGIGMVADARKPISIIIEGYQKAITKFNSVIPRADQYIEMAKALGDANIQKSLENTKKEANDMIKLSNNVIAKLKAL